MIDDLLAGVFGEALFGRLRQTARSTLILRLVFGLLGAGLGLAGALYVPATVSSSNTALVGTITALFISLASFFVFNVMLARPWRWPGLCFLCCLVLVFVIRIVLGP